MTAFFGKRNFNDLHKYNMTKKTGSATLESKMSIFMTEYYLKTKRFSCIFLYGEAPCPYATLWNIATTRTTLKFLSSLGWHFSLTYNITLEETDRDPLTLQHRHHVQHPVNILLRVQHQGIIPRYTAVCIRLILQ